jgi:osmoprotectant transport system substrate-binding protein
MNKRFASSLLMSVLMTYVVSSSEPALAQAHSFTVGSKNFTEQYLLAEMYAAALEGAGIPVERKINLGGTMIAQGALTAGEIDMYPEYTGTALLAVMKAPTLSDPDKAYQQVKAYYHDKFGLEWLTPAKVNNGYVLVVTPATAKKFKLASLSDLAKVSNGMSLGAGTEFADRADGVKGLQATYGMTFKTVRQFAKLGLRYDALQGGDVDVVNGAATDWQIGDKQYVALQDDKHFFPPYNVAPVVRRSALLAFPNAEKVLNSVTALLDNNVMQNLNARVEKDKEEPKDVAIAFLKQHGIATGGTK